MIIMHTVLLLIQYQESILRINTEAVRLQRPCIYCINTEKTWKNNFDLLFIICKILTIILNLPSIFWTKCPCSKNCNCHWFLIFFSFETYNIIICQYGIPTAFRRYLSFPMYCLIFCAHNWNLIICGWILMLKSDSKFFSKQYSVKRNWIT